MAAHNLPKAVSISSLSNKSLAKLVRKGQQYFDARDWPNAAKYYVEAWNREPDNKDLLVVIAFLLTQLGVREEAIAILERALETNGPTREVLSVMGQMASDMSMFDIAERLYRISLTQFPDDPAAYNNLATALGALDRADEAIDLLQQAIPVFPDDHNLWNTLGHQVSIRDGIENSLVFYEQALAIAPKDYRILNNLAQVHTALDNVALAMDFAGKAVAVDPDHYEAPLALSFLHLKNGQLAEGWKYYERRKDPRRKMSVIYTHHLPAWDGSSLEGKTLLLASEQGLGDELLFAAAYPALYEEAGKLLIGCDQRLVPILQRSFPEALVTTHASGSRTGYIIRSFPEFEYAFETGELTADWATEIGSVPGHRWPDLSALPAFPDGFLKADPRQVQKWKKRLQKLGPNPKVGLCWQSGKKDSQRGKHYFRLDELEPLLKIEGVDFVNLQYTDCAAEIRAAEDKFGITVHSWHDLDLKDDLEATFALISALDLVIGPGTTPAAMAVAVGTPVWWILKGRPWWCFGTEAAPLAPKGIFFSGPIDENFSKPIARVATSLAHFINSKDLKTASAA